MGQDGGVCAEWQRRLHTLPPSVGWWSKLPWIVSQLSQQGRQPVGALALLGELLQGLFFVQTFLLSPLVFLLSPLVFLLSPFLTGQNEVTIRICPAQPGIRLAFVGAVPERDPEAYIGKPWAALAFVVRAAEAINGQDIWHDLLQGVIDDIVDDAHAGVFLAFLVCFSPFRIRDNLNDHIWGLAEFPQQVRAVFLLPPVLGHLDIEAEENVRDHRGVPRQSKTPTFAAARKGTPCARAIPRAVERFGQEALVFF